MASAKMNGTIIHRHGGSDKIITTYLSSDLTYRVEEILGDVCIILDNKHKDLIGQYTTNLSYVCIKSRNTNQYALFVVDERDENPLWFGYKYIDADRRFFGRIYHAGTNKHIIMRFES